MKTQTTSSHLRAGDLVMIRTPREIMKTLDSNGTLDNLPFMPEMLEFCGKPFRVQNRVVQATVDAAFLGPQDIDSYVREFRNNDVVILQGVRCSGNEHASCQRCCAMFWKVAWLQKIESAMPDRIPDPDLVSAEAEEFRHVLRTKTEFGRYFCQSSEFLKATLPLSATDRVKKCFSAVAAGNISAWGMLKRIVVWMFWRAHYKLIGEHVHGINDKTPTGSLSLKPGELVQVKSLPEIVTTLNKKGRNRGLHFSADQRPFCGGRYRVKSRADNFIAEGSGEMKHFTNTVILENVGCDSACFAFGGCYRADLLYWRELWLKRVDAQENPTRSEMTEVCDQPADRGIKPTLPGNHVRNSNENRIDSSV